MDEETVKEVLSETPNPKPYLPKIEDEPKKLPSLHEIQEGVNYKNDVLKKSNSINPTAEEVSEEVSEICSTLSESVSTATFNEKRDNDVSGEVRQRMTTDRSPAKYRNRQVSGDLRSERVVGKSPARVSEQPPGRVRSINGRERRVVGHGESSGPGQRSRSPANRTDGGNGTRNGVGRSPSVRKTGKSPSRVGSDLHEKSRRREGGNLAPTASNESLENPLVSLECFIFL